MLRIEANDRPEITHATGQVSVFWRVPPGPAEQAYRIPRGGGPQRKHIGFWVLPGIDERAPDRTCRPRRYNCGCAANADSDKSSRRRRITPFGRVRDLFLAVRRHPFRGSTFYQGPAGGLLPGGQENRGTLDGNRTDSVQEDREENDPVSDGRGLASPGRPLHGPAAPPTLTSRTINRSLAGHPYQCRHGKLP